MMLLNCVHCGSDERSRHLLILPVAARGSVSTARLSIMEESSVKKSWLAAVDPGLYSSRMTTDDPLLVTHAEAFSFENTR